MGEPAGPVEGKSWDRFYEAREAHPVRPLLVSALGLMEAEGVRPGRAIELGCGQGIDTAELLTRGWRVLAVDSSEEGIARTRARADGLGLADSLETRQVKFEDLENLPTAELIYAALSLPFCPPEHFDSLWRHIRQAAQSPPGGWIAAQFFGPNDTWADNPRMGFHSREEVEALFAGLDVRVLAERDEDGQAISGPKHWHVFDVIAAPAS